MRSVHRFLLFLRTLRLSAILGLYVVLGLSTVFDGRGLMHLSGLTREREALEAGAFALLRENEALRDCIGRLEADAVFLEKIVREELGFVRPGEVVYRFDAPTGDAAAEWHRVCLSRFPANVPLSVGDRAHADLFR